MINNGLFSIGRINSTDEKYAQKIKITMRDESSGIGFVTVYIDGHDLAMALTGASERKMTFEVSAISNVGKRLERKPLSFTLSNSELLKECLDKNDKSSLIAYLEKNFAGYVESGWNLDSNISAKNSIGSVKDGILINVNQYSYV